jgi:hypothetical protein
MNWLENGLVHAMAERRALLDALTNSNKELVKAKEEINAMELVLSSPSFSVRKGTDGKLIASHSGYIRATEDNWQKLAIALGLMKK